MQNTANRFLSKHEATKLSGICERSLDYARARGDLPFYKISSRKILFSESDLLEYMQTFRVDVRTRTEASA